MGQDSRDPAPTLSYSRDRNPLAGGQRLYPLGPWSPRIDSWGGCGHRAAASTVWGVEVYEDSTEVLGDLRIL